MSVLFFHVELVICILCVDFSKAMHVLLLTNTTGVFSTEGFRRENILETVQRSPQLSTRRFASRISVSRTQVWRTVHEEQLRPYYDHRVQYR